MNRDPILSAALKRRAAEQRKGARLPEVLAAPQPLTPAQRAQVITLWRAGLASRVIGKRLGIHPTTAQRVVKAWRAA